MTYLISFISGIFTAFFGWAGGRGDDYWNRHKNWPRWMLQTQMRDLGIPTTITITSLIFGAVTWLLVPAFLLAWGACSTYRYFLPKPKDYTWPYYALHGLMIGLSAAPIAYATGHWWWFLIRSLMLAVWMGGWSAAIGNADLEESGRYFPVGFSIYMIC